ncbi:MAG: pyridoxal-phosphate dependent enzyme [Thiobacillus sp.]|nr:pyridoxal-phosphate dependent enzyme [Thiobacillus sp.]
MDGIKRRVFLKTTAAGGIALSIGGVRSLLAASEARAQGVTRRPAAWPNRRLLNLLKIEHPIVQAPMGGHTSPDMPVAVSGAGGLGSFPCALLTPAQVRDEVWKIRAQTRKPLNLNFFCHATPQRDAAIENAWNKRLAPYYAELLVDPLAPPATALAPFGAEMCDVVVALKPEVVSFQFGLPDQSLVDRLKAAGCKIFSTATTVAEARWLEGHGADTVIAQGIEAGGHRGTFLPNELASQLGTLALVPQVVDAVKVPVIAAGGIADGRGIAAALALGASAVQMGTAYLLCPEANISALYRAALKSEEGQGNHAPTQRQYPAAWLMHQGRTAMGKRYDSILSTIGHTPVIRINKLAPGGVNLYVKVESFNPMGSIKDRLALGVIEDAERHGELKPGQTIVEATSGNTGIGLAMVCAQKGYPLVITMAENFSVERRKLMRFLGARVVLTPAGEMGSGMVAKAAELAKAHGWWQPRQFENPANAEIHARTAAVEIIKDFADVSLDYWVTGFGTGGTLNGVSRVYQCASRPAFQAATNCWIESMKS